MIQQTNLYRQYLIVLFFSITCFIPKIISAQNIVSVNTLTGIANATIPIYNVSVGDLSAPVALTYNASGIRVEDYDNSFGLGWRLIANASITREVRGFPDDVEHQSSPVIKGWLKSSNTAPATIQSLTFANGGVNVTCAEEISDAATIANNFSYAYDTEPDYFTVSAPGLSCNFVFAANQNIKIIPYRDYQITTTADTYGRITAFTVINESGIKYYFDLTHFLNHNVPLVNPGTTVNIDPATLEIFKRNFLTYSKISSLGYPVQYGDTWMLTKMEDTRGNKITYNYGSGVYTIINPSIYARATTQEVDIIKPNGSGGFTTKKLYNINKSTSIFHLQSISTYSLGVETGTTQTVVQFSWGGGNTTNEDERLLGITLPQEKKKFELLYTIKFNAGSNAWDGYGRYFLKGLKAIHTSGLCDNVNTQFDFTYYAVNQANNTCYCAPEIPGTGTKLDTLINAQDYWGYYNGVVGNTDLTPQVYAYPDNTGVELFKVYEIPGYSGAKATLTSSSDRTVSTTHAKDGSLKTITYPAGGSTELEYENNNFFDPDVNGNVLGGGIRIKKITHKDGLGNTPDITEYSYNDPVNTSITTGRAISVPKFTVGFQNSTTYGNTTDKMKNTTYRTTYDLNNEPKDILYGKVTIKKVGTNGIGKSIYEYNTSGTFGSVNGSDWAETYNYVARTNLSTPPPCNPIAPTFLYNNNGELLYPFSSNTNFDFERGLPTKITHYNEAGQKVAEEEYSYSRSHTNPTKIYGVKLDEIGNTMAAYAKYGVNAVADNFLTTKTSKLYNSNSSNPVTDVETYEYTSPSSSEPYRLLKAVRKRNSGDPSTTFTVSRFKYSKEYAATSTTGDDMNEALYAFNNTLFKNVLIETTQSREESGPTEKFTGGSFNTFKKFTIGDVNGTTLQPYLPYKSYQFVNQTGVTNFTSSTIASNVFTWDNANYVNTPTTIEEYNTKGIPQLVTDNSRIPKTILSTPFVNSIKMAEFTNAKPEHVGFSNYDVGDFTGNFTFGGNAVVTGGRYSNNCLSFQPNTVLCRILNKSATTGNLIISFWLKGAAVNGSIYLCSTKFNPTCPTNACTDPVVSFTPNSQWKYYQAIVPFAASPATRAFYLSTSTAVQIDDLIIYPDNANVTSYSYTTNSIGINLLTAKTGINGIGNTYEYDNAGRLWLVKDQFDNIIEMKKYKLLNRHAVQIPSIEIGYEQPNYIVDVAGVFTAYPPLSYESGDCDMPRIAYNWDFGDGTTGFSKSIPNSGGLTTINHTYEREGTYVVTVTASVPGMTNIIAQTPPLNSTNPLPVTVEAGTGPCNTGTPVICASGIIQYTSTYQCILATCFSLPSTCSTTYFTVSGVTGGSMNSVYSVQWETAPEGSSSWTVYQPEPSGPGGLTTSKTFHIVHTDTYQMRARIRFCSSSGSTAYSNTILIKNGD